MTQPVSVPAAGALMATWSPSTWALSVDTNWLEYARYQPESGRDQYQHNYPEDDQPTTGPLRLCWSLHLVGDKLVSRGLVRGKLFRGDFVPGDVVRINPPRGAIPLSRWIRVDLPLLVSDFVCGARCQVVVWIT